MCIRIFNFFNYCAICKSQIPEEMLLLLSLSLSLSLSSCLKKNFTYKIFPSFWLMDFQVIYRCWSAVWSVEWWIRMANLARSGRKTGEYEINSAFFGKNKIKNSSKEGKQHWHLNLFLNRKNKNDMYGNLVLVDPCIMVQFLQWKPQQDATVYQNFILLLPGAELPSWKFWPSQWPLSISLDPGRRLSSFWSSFGRCPVSS